MTQALSEIRGRQVEEVVIGPSATTIKFVGGWGIAVFNDYKCANVGIGDCSSVAAISAGTVLEDAYVDEHTITLVFEGQLSIEIDLREHAFHGPEAAEIFGPSGEEIVIR